MTRRTELKELRCAGCGEYLGRISGSCTHAPLCSESCENQKPLRKSEARDSLVCEMRATGMTLEAIAAQLGLTDKRAVHSILLAF